MAETTTGERLCDSACATSLGEQYNAKIENIEHYFTKLGECGLVNEDEMLIWDVGQCPFCDHLLNT
jgi:UDP-3-O-acyl-N-acetylglucosamine deacetylase